MVSKKNKDAENGLQVFAIMGIIWTLGFLYLSWDGALSDLGLDQLSISCCSVINILLSITSLATWRYTKKENQMKDYLEEYFKKNDSVSVEHMIEKFRLSQSSAVRAISVWALETSVKGEYDIMSGIYSKEPEEEVLSFCPNCGKKMISNEDDKWCLDCQDI